jgi:hypothetical protein
MVKYNIMVNMKILEKEDIFWSWVIIILLRLNRIVRSELLGWNSCMNYLLKLIYLISAKNNRENDVLNHLMLTNFSFCDWE